MAKLNGVKVIEATNGEITKVTYGGAEFTLDIKANYQANTGDLIRINEYYDSDLIYGEFYEVVDVDRDGDAKYYDEDGDRRCLRIYDVYRKVQPQIIPQDLTQRVAELESEVAELQAEVSGLKAEKSEEFAKITEAQKWAKIGRKVGELKKGDIVRVLELHGAELQVGELIKVNRDSSVDYAKVKGNWTVIAELVAPVESLFNN